MAFAVGGIASLIAALLVWHDFAGVATFLARSQKNMTKPLTPQPDPSPGYVTWTRYSTSALLLVIGVLTLFAAFTQ